MKTFVLIIIIWTHYGISVDHVDGFTTEDSCVEVGANFVSEIGEFANNIGVRTYCAEKK